LCIIECIFGGFVSLSSQTKPASESQLIKPDSVQGCYELNLSAWRPNLSLGEDAEFITPPHRIELFAERGKQGWEANGYIVRPAPGVPASIHRGSYWLPKEPRSIEVVWTTGFSGLAMTLTINGEELIGKAKTHWDFERKQQTADVVARKVECQAAPTAVAPGQVDCQVGEGQPKIVAGEGWGPVRIGAASKTVDAFLGEGQSGRKYSQAFFKDYAPKGIQVSFENGSGAVHEIYFYNGQRDHPKFRVFCGQVDKGINWQSSVDDVKKAFGQPTAEFSGTDSGGTWKRVVFDGIDFRFENEKMVRIGIPGN
jgi:hypothetical protein